jgi:hypothetical protein
MVDIVTSQPVNTPGAGPEVSQPYAIPEGMTPADAKARLDELKQDKDFVAGLRKHVPFGGKSREQHEWDALIAHAAGAEKPSAPRLQRDPSAAELDTRTPQERAAAVPAEPSGYRLDYRLPGQGVDLTIPENAKLDTDIRGWLHAAGQTQQDAASLVDTLKIDAAKFAPMNDEQWQAHHDDTIERFNRIHGADAPAAMNTARAAIDAIERAHPGFKDFVAERGLGASLGFLFAAVNYGKAHGL